MLLIFSTTDTSALILLAYVYAVKNPTETLDCELAG